MSGRRAVPAALLLAAASLAVGCSEPVGLDEVRATVSLAEADHHYEAGQAVPMQVTVFNSTHQTIRVGGGLLNGSRLELVGAGEKRLEPGTVPAGEARDLRSGERTRFDLDLVGLFPGLAEPGEYLLTAVYPQFRSNTVRLRVIPAFDERADYRALVETDRGSFTLAFYPDIAPQHVRNFVNLARSGYYDGTVFHRVLRGTMIQSGDPTGLGHGGPGYTIRGEFSDRRHVRGTLSMARRPEDPDSAGSQWFVCLEPVREWDGQYTIFGEVVEGMETVDAIGKVPVRDGVPLEVVTVSRIVIQTTEGPS
jgi:cyclophilin family peptidyl-prolyl cis-trans isomerase